MKISFIIPVYNCEGYLKGLFDNLHSELKDAEYEIILINDGSTDESGKLCDEFATKDRNVRVIHQQNAGASTARNKGLDIATGDWIWMVDADDQIAKGIIDIITPELGNNDADVLCFNHSKLTEHGIVADIRCNEKHKISGIEYLEGSTSLFLWDKLFRRTIIGNHRFLDGTKTIEDFLFCIETLKDVKVVQMIPESGYIYNCLNTSSTQRNRSRENLMRTSSDSIAVHKKLYNIIKSESGRQRDILSDMLNFSISGHLFSVFRFMGCRDLKLVIDEYQQLNLYPVKKTHSARANKFLIIANNKILFLTLAALKLGHLAK